MERKRISELKMHGYLNMERLVSSMNLKPPRGGASMVNLLPSRRQGNTNNAHEDQTEARAKNFQNQAKTTNQPTASEVNFLLCDCIQINENISDLKMNDLAVGATMEIIIVEAISPSHFWYVKCGQAYYTELIKMTMQMAQYYEFGTGKDRILPRGAVKVGGYCTTHYQNKWCRSIIVKVVDRSTVRVRLLDFASVVTFQISKLKPLLWQWAQLPTQARRARLANVMPVAREPTWSFNAKAFFVSCVKGKNVSATVLGLDHEENYAELLLECKIKEQQVSVSRELLGHGYASFQIESSVKKFHNYLRPCFAEFENGELVFYSELAATLRADDAILHVIERKNPEIDISLPSTSGLHSLPASTSSFNQISNEHNQTPFYVRSSANPLMSNIAVVNEPLDLTLPFTGVRTRHIYPASFPQISNYLRQATPPPPPSPFSNNSTKQVEPLDLTLHSTNLPVYLPLYSQPYQQQITLTPPISPFAHNLPLLAGQPNDLSSQSYSSVPNSRVQSPSFNQVFNNYQQIPTLPLVPSFPRYLPMQPQPLYPYKIRRPIASELVPTNQLPTVSDINHPNSMGDIPFNYPPNQNNMYNNYTDVNIPGSYRPVFIRPTKTIRTIDIPKGTPEPLRPMYPVTRRSREEPVSAMGAARPSLLPRPGPSSNVPQAHGCTYFICYCNKSL